MEAFGILRFLLPAVRSERYSLKSVAGSVVNLRMDWSRAAEAVEVLVRGSNLAIEDIVYPREELDLVRLITEAVGAGEHTADLLEERFAQAVAEKVRKGGETDEDTLLASLLEEVEDDIKDETELETVLRFLEGAVRRVFDEGLLIAEEGVEDECGPARYAACGDG